ncbi:ester cyclase [Sandaracinobacteroides saxicola]|uniref:Ester cyclase n=1 Tax=Sandaracinobacteroides saxicola TaxID=2759707 RepID=A0A7G5II71_9SPHN|nr:ester cyclase [Sandaracinobacteroides saxicola]QMW23063.1 ester cyclase [Sandaracinobacteroides saxicola]
MRGFDPKFTSFPDYIEKITREIWEDRGIGLSLRKYYAPDVIVRASNAIITDNRGVTAATLATLNEFPDRRLVYEDVIWAGNDDEGYISSHRLISVMRKQNDGAYGKGLGQLVRSRIIADCVVHEGVITEEWLVRDHGAFAACLGTTPRALAETMIARGDTSVFTPANDKPGPYRARIEDGAEARRYAEAWRTIWGAKTPAAIRDHYHQGVTAFVANGEVLSGHEDLDRFVVGYLASFPDAALTVDHLIVNRDPGQPVRLALRWSIEATHKGWGRFGEPTGAPVYILGMTHAYMVDGRVTMEWITIDEVAIWKQILAAG